MSCKVKAKGGEKRRPQYQRPAPCQELRLTRLHADPNQDAPCRCKLGSRGWSSRPKGGIDCEPDLVARGSMATSGAFRRQPARSPSRIGCCLCIGKLGSSPAQGHPCQASVQLSWFGRCCGPQQDPSGSFLNSGPSCSSLQLQSRCPPVDGEQPEGEERTVGGRQCSCSIKPNRTLAFVATRSAQRAAVPKAGKLLTASNKTPVRSRSW